MRNGSGSATASACRGAGKDLVRKCPAKVTAASPSASNFRRMRRKWRAVTPMRSAPAVAVGATLGNLPEHRDPIPHLQTHARRLKMLAVERDATLQALGEEAFDELLRRYGR